MWVMSPFKLHPVAKIMWVALLAVQFNGMQTIFKTCALFIVVQAFAN